MLFDWQTVAVALVVLAATLYLARMVLRRARSMRAGADGASTGSDCSGCGSSKVKSTAPAPKVLVQIGRAQTPPRR